MRIHVVIFMLAALSMAAAETRVRVTGMHQKSESQVLDLMGDRLVHVRSNPAATHLADDAAFILRRILRNDGHVAVEVDWKIVSRDEILLIVREGLRHSLGEVRVTGVSADEARGLAKVYAKPAEKGRSLTMGDPPFREEDVASGVLFVRQELNSRGHWNVEVKEAGRKLDPVTGKMDITIDVQPGPLFHIGRPRVTSADGRGVKLTTETALPFTGRPATTANLNAMRAAVEEKVISRGYPDASIRMSHALTVDQFIPEFGIDLGTRVRLNRLRIEGLERTRPARVAARFKGMEGEWYDEAAMNKRLREFLATGAFDFARVETTPAGHRLVDATLHFDEGRAREVGIAAGIGSYQGFLTRFEYGDRNFGGNLLGFSAGLEIGSRGLLGEVRLTDPWLMGSDIAATARIYAMIYGREGYEKYETGVEGKLSRRFGDHYLLDLLAGYSVVGISGDGLPSGELGEESYTHPRLRVTQTLDYRDNPVLPKNGWHLSIPLEMGAALGDSADSYFLAGLEGGWFHPLGRRTQLGIGGEWKVLMPSGDGAELPIDLRLFNGGSRSVRSFPERELGPSADGYPTGGEAMWNVNVELTRDITGILKGVWFFDAGSLDRNFEDMGSSDIELATGLGIRLELPIGPIRLEYGHNLTRDRSEPAGTFHFAIGHAF
jgi:outer membrane protein insertion porin family